MPLILAYVGLWATVTGGVWALFARTETVISPEARTAVSRWLRNLDPTGALANWPAAFAAVFDRVFRERHLSWRCFSRSCVASWASVLIVFFVWGVLRPAQFTALIEDIKQEGLFSYYIYVFLITTGILNLVPDYISLLETRYVIRWMSGERSMARILFFLAIDFAFTFTIAFVAYSLFFIFFWRFPVGEALRSFFTDTLALSSPDYPAFPSGIFFYSTFFTSVWVWLYALSGFIVKLGEYLGVGFSWLKAILDIRNKPLRSMGLILDILISIAFLISLPFLIFLPFLR